MMPASLSPLHRFGRSITILLFIGCFLAIAIVFLNSTQRSVSGRITDQQGRPLPGVEVRAVPLPLFHHALDQEIEPRDKQDHRTRTDQNGRYHLEGLMPGFSVNRDLGWVRQDYTIAGTLDGYAEQRLRIHVEQGNVTDADFVLER